MAYANLLEIACASRAEAFMRFRDFVCKRNGTYDYSTTGIGWTLHDSSYAVSESSLTTNDYIVIYSPGEGGDDDLYFKCSYIANYISIVGYLYWNNSTHSGVQAYGAGSNFYIADADVPLLWVYGDLDQVLAVSRRTSISTDFYEVDFGKPTDDQFDDDIVTCAGALSSGSDVSINVGTVPTAWYVGQKIFIRDTVRINIITIKTKDASTITADLANNFVAGSKLSSVCNYRVALGPTNFLTTDTVLITRGGSLASNSYSWTAATSITGASLDPLNSDPVGSYISLTGASLGCMGKKKNVLSRTTTGITDLNVYTDGTNDWRAFKFYNGVYAFVREV